MRKHYQSNITIKTTNYLIINDKKIIFFFDEMWKSMVRGCFSPP